MCASGTAASRCERSPRKECGHNEESVGAVLARRSARRFGRRWTRATGCPAGALATPSRVRLPDGGGPPQDRSAKGSPGIGTTSTFYAQIEAAPLVVTHLQSKG